MIKIGIDFSIVSPALCIYKDGEYSFISFFDNYGEKWETGKSKKFNYHRLLKNIIEIQPYTRVISKENYRQEQKSKMISAKMIANLIVSRLKEIVGEEDVVIGLEGFSYGSMSSATIDLAVYNSFLRIKLLEAFGDDCLVIISPSEGKKNLSGKGNAKKDDMIKAFINNRVKDPDIERNVLWKFCKENGVDFKHPKPIDDLVDSYGILISI